jgi:fumarate reductase subunit C
MVWHTRGVVHPPTSTERGSCRTYRPRHWAGILTLFLATTLSFGCSRGESSDAERFCGEIAADPVALVSPLITDVDQLASTVAHYEMLIRLAPVDIESEMMRILVAIETAAAVDPEDEETLQTAALTAYASEAAAVRVAEWVKAWCGVDLGPVTTITPHGPAVIPQPSTGTVPAG